MIINSNTINTKKIMAIANQGMIKLIKSITGLESSTVRAVALAMIALMPIESPITLVFCSKAKTKAQTSRTGKMKSKRFRIPKSNGEAMLFISSQQIYQNRRQSYPGSFYLLAE